MHWVNVKEHLPKRGKLVRVKLSDGSIEKATLIHNDWIFRDLNFKNMTECWKHSQKIMLWKEL
jgi:hypothetical protein